MDVGHGVLDGVLYPVIRVNTPSNDSSAGTKTTSMITLANTAHERMCSKEG